MYLLMYMLNTSQMLGNTFQMAGCQKALSCFRFGTTAQSLMLVLSLLLMLV